MSKLLSIHWTRPLKRRTVLRDARNNHFMVIGHVGHLITLLREGGTVEVIDTRNIQCGKEQWQEVPQSTAPAWINNFLNQYKEPADA